MYMPERPVIHLGQVQIIQRTRSVRVMIRVAVDVCVHQANRKRVGIDLAESSRQIVVNIARRIADSIHDRAFWVILKHWYGLEASAKTRTAWRVNQPRLPSVKRIVIAVADKRTYASIAQLLQP